MNDFKELLMQTKTLVIFKSLKERNVIKKLLLALEACEDGKMDKAVEKYCDFAAQLYTHSDNLTRYILRLALENENLYMLKKGEGKETGALLDECLASELMVLQDLSRISSEAIISKIGYSGFLPRYKTEELDFSKIYADRIHQINQYGYGIYSHYHVFVIKNGSIVPVEYPDPIRLSQLSGYERERKEVIDNTLALLKGKPANNVLLYGDCGTGKSSTVKAIANEYYPDGLRLIELKKKQLHEIPAIVEVISKNPLKFIIFIDDLSFTEDDDDFAALKAILEGSVSSTASNLAIYATSNRRHLVRETFSAREGDEIHFNDTMQELLSLSDRFGLTVTYSKPNKELFLSVVRDLAGQYGLKMPEDEVCAKAEAFALTRGGRSPRVAKQFIEYLKGIEE
ncbi:ATP-binding protein [Ruminococcus sp. Marseille-P6503]|uniref:ATP-binding protein n=1 Tax=Ruminococcus sp. Marseille-P6503 TaxID=2364796 RepID=UPI000F52FD04|nr:ATP-binding protein [Ruminococcus sp. Marseille-P6503]